jgi:uncharacterized membrane protein YkoI
MKHQSIVSLAAAAGVAVGGVALAKTMPDSASSPSFSGHTLAAQASVSLANARSIALKARPGVITDQELEREHGGSGLRYSFDVKSAGAKYEVGVDAKTGKVLENGRDTDAD